MWTLIAVGVFFAVFLWEHIGRLYAVPSRPSWALWKVVDLSRWCWSAVGKVAAWLASWINLVDFYEVIRTAQDLVSPLLQMLASCFWVVKGYVETIDVNNWSYEKIGIGAVMLTATTVGTAVHFFTVPVLVTFFCTHTIAISVGAIGLAIALVGGYIQFSPPVAQEPSQRRGGRRG